MQQSYIAKTPAGLESVLANELTALGAENVAPLTRAVKFEGDLKVLYKANLCLRTALRILRPIHTFQAKDYDEMYRGVREIDWSKYINTGSTFVVSATVGGNEEISHSHYTALKTKDAIADQFNEKLGKRPSVDTINPDLYVDIHIYKDQCTLSLDSSGESLHRRGYRADGNLAPLNEVLAAGMVLLSKWNKEGDFVDFFCGSGTLSIEAAMYALNIPPGSFRERFAFMYWPDFDVRLWKNIKEDALKLRKAAPNGSFFASDASPRAIAIARENITRAGLADVIELEVVDFRETYPDLDHGVVILNPPYGERIETAEEIGVFYWEIGQLLKRNFRGFDAWIITSDKALLGRMGMKAEHKYELNNGGIDCVYHHYPIYGADKYGGAMMAAMAPSED
jgi:putative N6-adenine-specific DNA methylase